MPHRPHVAAAALVLGVGLVAASVVPATAVTAQVAVTVLGEGGWFGHRTVLDTTWQVRAEAHAADGRDALILNTPDSVVVVRAPLSSPRLFAGQHYAPTHYPDRVSGWPDPEASLTVSSHRTSCPRWQVGSFDVLALTRDAAGVLASLALDYELTCTGDPAPVRGSVRWNSDVPFQHTSSTSFEPAPVVAGETARGTVTLTNNGSGPQTYGPVTWEGSSDRPVVVERDGCAGVTLTPGGTCAIDVSAHPAADHPVQGVLRTSDGTARGAAYAQVDVRVEKLTAPELDATPRRGGVELSLVTSPRPLAYRVLRSDDGGPEAERATGVTLPWTDTDVDEGAVYSYRVVAVAGEGQSPPSNEVTTGPLPVPQGAEGTFVPVQPARVLDTRIGTGARRGPVGPDGSIRFDPAASGAIPATGVQAVVLNVTGTEPTAATHVRVWPAGDPLPDTSSVNLVPGQSRPNSVVVPLGDDGQVALHNNSGSTHLIVDVQGYYSDVDGVHGSGYHPRVPMRYLDTRLDVGTETKLAPGQEMSVWVPVTVSPWTDMSAVDVNITVTEPTAAGHIVAWPGDGSAPGVSNVNFTAGQTIANHSVVPVKLHRTSSDWWAGYVPRFVVRNNSTGWTEVIVDVQGWYDDGTQPDALRYAPVETARVTDTRRSGERVKVDEVLEVPGDVLPPARAHVINLTATQSTGPGHLTAWDGQNSRPWTSSVNYLAGEDAPNSTTVLAGPDGQMAVSARSASAHVIVDYVGFFY
ncbi:hypothetical protein ACWFNE_20430 [Cellulomonas sp. NPDC055163]